MHETPANLILAVIASLIAWIITQLLRVALTP
jgi:hypothetical protein